MYASQEETGLRRSGAPLNRRRPPPAGAGELGGGPWPCMGPRRLGGVGAPRPHLPRHEAMGLERPAVEPGGAAAERRGVERVTAHSGRVGLAAGRSRPAGLS